MAWGTWDNMGFKHGATFEKQVQRHNKPENIVQTSTLHKHKLIVNKSTSEWTFQKCMQTVPSIQITVLWVMTPCSFVSKNQHFEGTCYVHVEGWWTHFLKTEAACSFEMWVLTYKTTLWQNLRTTIFSIHILEAWKIIIPWFPYFVALQIPLYFSYILFTAMFCNCELSFFYIHFVTISASVDRSPSCLWHTNL